MALRPHTHQKNLIYFFSYNAFCTKGYVWSSIQVYLSRQGTWSSRSTQTYSSSWRGYSPGGTSSVHCNIQFSEKSTNYQTKIWNMKYENIFFAKFSKFITNFRNFVLLTFCKYPFGVEPLCIRTVKITPYWFTSKSSFVEKHEISKFFLVKFNKFS